MNIKNYTSSVPVETTMARIECKLAAIGASHIMKTYGPDKRVSAIIFNMPNGARSYPVKLPANVRACYDALWKDYCTRVRRPNENTKTTIMEQACRTAWKLIYDWIDVQTSMIALQQAKQLEIFLPFVWDGEQTYFERLEGGGFKQLPASTT